MIDCNDTEILAAKKFVDGLGIGCEPASACSVAGTKKLVENGTILASDRVVGILTGHLLKDAETALSNVEASQMVTIKQNQDPRELMFN